MTPLQSFAQRAEDIRRGVLDRKIPMHHYITFTALELSEISQELSVNQAALETTKREVSDTIKKLENLYSELAPTPAAVLRLNTEPQ